jgi:penicillin-insensitive murein endopeptidase
MPKRPPSNKSENDAPREKSRGFRGGHWQITIPVVIIAGMVIWHEATNSAKESSIATDAVAGPSAPVRNMFSEDRRPRSGLDHPGDESLHVNHVQDDPYEGDDDEEEMESDGAPDAVAPPIPSNLPTGGNRSFSIGKANAGWLVNGKIMPLNGPHHRVLARPARRGWYYGTDELVDLLKRAAEAVARDEPGSILRLGNLSRPKGGNLGTSRSHQSGRDVDVGLYCTDLDGNIVDPRRFPKFDGSRGELVDTSGRYLFDIQRNWAFVEALLGDKNVRVQWIFLDRPLKQLMLDYAIRNERDPKVIEHAEKVVFRPPNSSPHANHFHIRLFCSQADMDHGCRAYGPEWSWVKKARKQDDEKTSNLVDRVMKGDRDALWLKTDSDGGQAPITSNKPGDSPPNPVDAEPKREPPRAPPVTSKPRKDPPKSVNINL